MSTKKVTNVIFAGLGGQGVLKASDILADAAFKAGLDVKKSEVHGMSSVAVPLIVACVSDITF